MAKIIQIDSVFRLEFSPSASAQPKQNKGKREHFVNSHVERSAVRQFVLGNSIRVVSRREKVAERTVEQALREQLVQAGVLNFRRAA